MFAWFRRFTHPLGQIDPVLAQRRLRPVRVRAYTPPDFDRCIELYRLNERGRFPEGILPEYESWLREEGALKLVVEDQGVLVASGGIVIQRTSIAEMANLCFGLVHPEHHRRGLGSALLLARMAFLPSEAWRIFLQAVPSSRTFYEEFGFQRVSDVKLPSGETMTFLSAYLSPDDRELSRTLLQRARVELPAADLIVPVCENLNAG